MKRLSISIALTAVLASSFLRPAHAQDCSTYIRLGTQAQVNAFTCTETTNTLEIRQLRSGDPIVDLSPLSVLTTARRLEITSNPALESLAGLENLTSVRFALWISANTALASLDGLESLESVGELDIQSNPELTSLAGLRALNAVDGTVFVANNASLSSLDGLENLVSVSLELVIRNNPSLTDCAGLTGLISEGEFAGVDREVVIRDNASGGACNSPEQVLGAVTSVEEIGGAELPIAFRLSQNYPNPFNPVTAIDFDLRRSGTVRLAVYDMLGREAAVLASGEFAAGSYRATWDASGYPSGVYTYRLQAEGFSGARTLVLQK